MKFFFHAVFILVYNLALPGSSKSQEADLKLLDWKPKSQLAVKETNIVKPKFAVIDIHNHLGSEIGNLKDSKKYLEEMDKAGVWKCVSLDGSSENDFYKTHLEVSNSISRERLLVFFRPQWEKIDEPGFGAKEAAKLQAAASLGIKGVKVTKELGLGVKDKSGKLVPVDDPRLDPIWEKAGELGLPVLMHISDPKAFFDPIDRFNERYDELGQHPDWSFHGEQFPSKEQLLRERNHVFSKHPNTIFISTHMANLPEDLSKVAAWLDQYPNMYVDIAARISDIGRQPYTARRFMIQYQDRILFGSDTPCDAKAYSVYYRFLETDDEYFDPAPSHHQQGRWMIYGVYLPDTVLEKIYNKNALKILSMNKIEQAQTLSKK